MPQLQWLPCPLVVEGPRVTRSTPQDTVIYAIGDIHGCSELLESLLRGIEQDINHRSRSRHVVIFLGDYLTRGRDSVAVLNQVMAWRPSTPGLMEVVTLKGNHEDLACRFLQGDMEAGRHWFDYDGMDALVDYGVIATDPAARDDASLLSLRDRFAQALPPPHLAFLQALSISHREGDYHFVHAGVRPGVVLADQNDQDQMWIRKRFLESEVEHGAIVVHGHSISAQPEVRHNRIGIDTGAYASGVLTCLVLDGAKREFLQCVGLVAPACKSTSSR